MTISLSDEGEKREAERTIQLKELIRKGIEAADRGELVDGEAVFKELREKNCQQRQSRS